MKALISATSGLKAQSGRMRVIAENIANADSTARVAGGDPYRRRIPTFKAELERETGTHVVELGRVRPDMSDFPIKYDPNHPGADEKGYVKLPNVNTLIEAMDMRSAQRAYEANLNVVQATRRMIASTVEKILRG